MTRRYFFHIAGDLDIRDPSGGEYASEAAARRSAEIRLRTLRQRAAARRVKIVVMDAADEVLFEVDELEPK